MKLSIVSPVYKAENIIPTLVDRIEKAVAEITTDYEIILVEDASPDNSWSVIESIVEQNKKVKGVKFSRNFGQHYAITAGLDHSSGDWIVVMDCDLQDVPEEIPQLYNKALEGFDAVLASRKNRNDRYFKKLFSKLFFKLLSYLTGSKYDETIANFGIYNRKLINAVLQMREPIRSFPTLVKWVGFTTTTLVVRHDERFEGESTYNFKRLVHLALDIVLSNSDKPLRLLLKIGTYVSLTSLIVAVVYFIRWIMGETTVLGYTSLIVSIWFLSGIIIATLGIVGIYVGKIFNSSKNRPLYVVDKVVN